jgi:hypothetical protein
VALDLPSISLADGDIVDVFAIGGANGWPLDVASRADLKMEFTFYLPNIIR